MVSLVAMSERLSFSIPCSSQTALAHQPVHVRTTLTILLISIGVKQLLDCLILQKMPLFSMSVYRGTKSQTVCVLTLFHLKIIGINKN